MSYGVVAALPTGLPMPGLDARAQPSQLWFVRGALMTGVLLGFGLEWYTGRTCLALMLLMALLVLEQPLSLKNFFLAYTYCLFNVAGPFFYPEDPDIYGHLLLYLTLFAVCYGVCIHMVPACRSHDRIAPPKTGGGARPPIVSRLEYLLCYWLLLRGLILANTIRQYGLSAFLNGEALADRLDGYSSVGFLPGLLTAAGYAVKILEIALVPFYVSRSLRWGVKPRIGLLLGILVVMPLLSLERSAVANGMCLFLLLQSFQPGKIRQGLSPRLMFLLAAGGLAVFFVGLTIGNIRHNRLSGENRSFLSGERLTMLIAGELSPIVFYVESKDRIEYLGYQRGRTIFAAALFKPIPRRWYPDKPHNTSAYYMQLVTPDAFEAGYQLAPSIYGDLYLNYGVTGCAAGCLLLAAAAAFLDRRFLDGSLRHLPLFVMVYANAYSIMRNNIADSLGILGLAVCSYQALRWAFPDRAAIDAGASTVAGRRKDTP